MRLEDIHAVRLILSPRHRVRRVVDADPATWRGCLGMDPVLPPIGGRLHEGQPEDLVVPLRGRC